jgi:nanoRNase/pAp phosphatase (c-di-AMP/oligoRNAs hydrolase)
LWFDHHSSEEERLQLKFQGDSQTAPSAARVIYRYYVDKKKLDFSRLDALVDAVDKSHTAQFTREEIENPQGWVLLSFIMDPRTGLGRFHDFRISNYQLMVDLVDECRTKSIDEILRNPDVAERVRAYQEQNAKFRQMLQQHSHVRGNVVVLDLREVETIWSGNRFLIYALFPQQNVSIQVMQGRDRQNIVFAVGHSVLNRTCKTDIGSLMLRYGGGGHRGVGTCQVAHEDAERVLDELVVYTTEHFAREEEYTIHEALTRKVEELRMKFFMGEIEHLGKETLAFMKEWLATHILKEDMQYHPDKRR